MKAYRLSDEAQKDLRDIKKYLESAFGREKTLELLRGVTDAFAFIAKNPGAGHVRQDLTSLPRRFWVVHPYLIIYSIGKGYIGIARVLHGSRDVASILHRD